VIDVLGPVIAAAHGGCMECDPNDDRGDDIYVFQLGSFKIRLCRQHCVMLRTGLVRAATVVGQRFQSADDKITWADAQAMARNTKAVEALLVLLDDPDDNVVAAAADAIGHIGGVPARAAWQQLARLLLEVSRPAWLRDTCAYALGRIGIRNSEVLEALNLAVTDQKNPSVARCAREALQQLNGP
jgi:hypothetical protein